MERIIKINKGYILDVFCVHESVTLEELIQYCVSLGYYDAFITNRKFNGGEDNGCICEQHSDRRHWRVDYLPMADILAEAQNGGYTVIAANGTAKEEIENALILWRAKTN